MPFSREDLDALDRAKEVRIETSAGPGKPIHRTIIWVVVDRDEVFIRSWRGVTARWYREALANPDVAIHVGKRRLSARAVPAHDADAVSRTSAELKRKYEGDPAAGSMVRDETLITTLRLEPGAG
jgi:hypothetical protein